MPANPPWPLTLELRGLGHVPSFKNGKFLTRGKLITKPEYQKWMNAAIRAFVSQFLSVARTEGAAISTAPQRRSWIALSVPCDDSRQSVCRIVIQDEQIEPGCEGAELVITRMSGGIEP